MSEDFLSIMREHQVWAETTISIRFAIYSNQEGFLPVARVTVNGEPTLYEHSRLFESMQESFDAVDFYESILDEAVKIGAGRIVIMQRIGIGEFFSLLETLDIEALQDSSQESKEEVAA